jgi:phosphate transport system permease protein
MTAAAIAGLRGRIARGRRYDVWFSVLGFLATLVGVLTLTALFVDLLIDGWARLGWDFFSSYPSRKPERAGILSAWVGTALVMLVTVAAAVPLGVGAGIYLEEYAPRNWLTALIEINVTNLAGVPSIVYGLLALGLFVYTLDLGRSVLSAGLTLALLILPVVIVATREAIRAVPQEIREAAYSVGASRWQVVRSHILPCSAAGVLTGVIIGLARAIGETAPVITIGALTFVAFLPPAPLGPDAPWLNFRWLFSDFTVLPIQMFNWVSRPEEAFLANAAAAGVVIIAMTLLMNGFAIYLRYRLRQASRW